MKAHGIECCQGARRSRNVWRRGAHGGLLFAVLAVLTPKCPMCIAAWLGVLGLSGLATVVDPRVLWLVVALTVAVVGPLIAHRLFGRGNMKGDVT